MKASCYIALGALGLATLWGVVAPRDRTYAAAAETVRGAGAIETLDWRKLLPEAERGKADPAPPAAIHDYLGEGGLAALQSGSFAVNQALDRKHVRLPGFIVPLEMTKDGRVRDFFLVPYFGACIHVPPPPPNQIVFVRMREGIPLSSMDDAQWVTGNMRTSATTSGLGDAAYRLEGEKIEPYR